jgi:RNA polymerase primary sigma factor
MLTFPKCVSLNETINEEGDELIELIPSELDDDDDSLIVDERIKNEINNTLSILDDREREIIESYFGINTNCEAMTLEAIGEKYDLTKERIRQIKEKAIRKLRHNAHDLFTLINE